jgi:hypothetical protein
VQRSGILGEKHDHLLYFTSKQKLLEMGSLINGIAEGIRDALKIADAANFSGDVDVIIKETYSPNFGPYRR